MPQDPYEFYSDPKETSPPASRGIPHKFIYLTWVALLAITICLSVYSHSTAENRVVYKRSDHLRPLPAANATHFVSTEPIELKGRRNLKISANTLLNGPWAWVGVEFINEETRVIEAFELSIEDDGREWSQGNRCKVVYAFPDKLIMASCEEIYISPLPAGRYTLRLKYKWGRFDSPSPFGVTVTEGVARNIYIALALAGISFIPFLTLVYDLGIGKSGAYRWTPSRQASLMLNKIYLAFEILVVLLYAVTVFFGYEYGLHI